LTVIDVKLSKTGIQNYKKVHEFLLVGLDNFLHLNDPRKVEIPSKVTEAQ